MARMKNTFYLGQKEIALMHSRMGHECMLKKDLVVIKQCNDKNVLLDAKNNRKKSV